jgi:phosphopantetheinyl transferase
MLEQTYFQPNPNNLPLITLLWSMKEAMFKWWGRGEVDFSEMLQIAPFQLQENGQVVAMFVKETAQLELSVRYVQFPKICLAWLATETEHLFV